MKKSIIAALALAVSLAAGISSAQAADQKYLADRHIAAGMQCATCHKDGAPKAGAVVSKDTCKSCHNPADLAKATANLNPNPHYNHLGDVNCTDCHKGHQQPQLMCNDCHKFSLKVK